MATRVVTCLTLDEIDDIGGIGDGFRKACAVAADLAGELATAMTVDEARRTLTALPRAALEPVERLAGPGGAHRDAIAEAIAEWPFLALALVRIDARATIASIEARIEAERAAIGALEAMGTGGGGP
jgi:hypothetical protein